MAGARPLVRAWLGLVGLGALTSAVAAAVDEPPVPWLAAVAVLALAWAKARLILRAYLGLAATPVWSRAFTTVLAFYAALLLGLFLLPAISRP